jgi:hypothetical protein
MDEYIGGWRVRVIGVVVTAVPGEKIAWRLKLPVPVSLTLELADRDSGVVVRHTIRAGFTGAGRILDPLFRIYFFKRFAAAAMDSHVRTEFPLLRDRLARTRLDGKGGR